jgi:hypothetical protein
MANLLIKNFPKQYQKYHSQNTLINPWYLINHAIAEVLIPNIFKCYLLWPFYISTCIVQVYVKSISRCDFIIW